MEIRVLIENTPARGLMNEHGLSLYIVTEKQAIFWIRAAAGLSWKMPGCWGSI